MALLSSTGRQPAARRRRTPMAASGIRRTPLAGGGYAVDLDAASVVTYPTGTVTVPAGVPATIYGGGGASLDLDNHAYCLFILPGSGTLYACRQQDYAAIAAAMDIAPRYYLIGPDDLWLPPSGPGGFPVCAGMDPAHRGRVHASWDSNGTLIAFRVNAGRALYNGTSIAFAQQDVPIPGGVAGTFVIGVDASGVLHGTPGTAVPPTQILLETVYLAGSGLVFRNNGGPGDDVHYDGSGTRIAPWASTDPIVMPRPASFTHGDFRGLFGYPPAPPPPLIGYWGGVPGTGAAVYTPQFDGLANSPAYTNPLTAIHLRLYDWVQAHDGLSSVGQVANTFVPTGVNPLPDDDGMVHQDYTARGQLDPIGPPPSGSNPWNPYYSGETSLATVGGAHAVFPVYQGYSANTALGPFGSSDSCTPSYRIVTNFTACP